MKLKCIASQEETWCDCLKVKMKLKGIALLQEEKLCDCPEVKCIALQQKVNTYKGLFINDVIIFGGYCDPPSPSSSFVTFWLPPLIARVTRDITDFATKQRMLDFGPQFKALHSLEPPVQPP